MEEDKGKVKAYVDGLRLVWDKVDWENLKYKNHDQKDLYVNTNKYGVDDIVKTECLRDHFKVDGDKVGEGMTNENQDSTADERKNWKNKCM